MPHSTLLRALLQVIKEFIQPENYAMSAGTGTDTEAMDQSRQSMLGFLRDLANGLEGRSPELLAKPGDVLEVYRRLKLSDMTANPDLYRKALRHATTIHPHCHTLVEASMAKVIELVGKFPIHQIVADVLAVREERERELYTMEALRLDPSILYSFEREIDNRSAPKADLQDLCESSCPVCLEEYSETVDVYAPSCAHALCKPCAQGWLRGTTGEIFNCIQCRACLICSDQACVVHRLPDEEARLEPVPLHKVLNLRFSDDGLHEIPPHIYWELREMTRPHRQMLAEFNEKLNLYVPLGPNAQDVDFLAVTQLKENIMELLLRAVDTLCGEEWTAASHRRSEVD